MTDEELAIAFGELRTVCTTIIGFDALADPDQAAITEANRLIYHAQVYAGGIDLAHRVMRIAEALEDHRRD